MWKLSYYYGQIEALTDNVKLALYWVTFECIIIHCASETSYDSFSTLLNFKFPVKEPLYMFLYNVKEMSELCKYVKLWRFIN